MDALNIRVINNHNQVIGTPDDPPGTPTVIGLLKETYNRLHTATENTNLDITNLQDRITTLENTVDGSDTADPPIQGLSTRVEELENTVIEQTLSIQNNTDDISENRTNIARNGATILTLQNKLNDTNTEISRVERSLSRQISSVSARVTLGLDTLSARVTQIDDSETGRLSILETTVSNLVDEVEGQDGALEDITNLQADVSILDTNVGTLQTDVGTLQTDVGTLQTGVGTLQTGVGTLQTNVGTLQTNVGTLQTDVGTLQTTVNNLHLGVGESTNQTGGERFNLYDSTGNTASGNYSHAEGYSTKATNNSSHAEGYNTTAGGMYSHAAGEYIYADSKSLTAVGRYNTWASGLGAQYTRLFLVGNGSSNSVRSEAFVVNYDGSVIINSTRSGTTPSLTIGPNSKAITNTTGASTSTETDDAVLTTKYYVDTLVNSISSVMDNPNKFNYFGPATVRFGVSATQSSSYDLFTTTYVNVNYNSTYSEYMVRIPHFHHPFRLAYQSYFRLLSVSINLQFNDVQYNYTFSKSYPGNRQFCGNYAGSYRNTSNGNLYYLEGVLVTTNNSTSYHNAYPVDLFNLSSSSNLLETKTLPANVDIFLDLTIDFFADTKTITSQ